MQAVLPYEVAAIQSTKGGFPAVSRRNVMRIERLSVDLEGPTERRGMQFAADERSARPLGAVLCHRSGQSADLPVRER